MNKLKKYKKLKNRAKKVNMKKNFNNLMKK